MEYREGAELKLAAKERLSGHFGNAIGVVVVYALVIGAATPVFGIGLLVSGAMSFGLCAWFLSLERGREASFVSLFDGFSQFGRTLSVWFFSSLFAFLWSLLLIVPGIVKALGYSMIYYIMADNRELEPMEVLRESEELMRGHKGRLFGLILSFLPWFILCGLTFGLASLYVVPYFQATMAGFYEDLRKR